MSHRPCSTCRQPASFVCVECRLVFCTVSGCAKRDSYHPCRELGPFGGSLSIVPREKGFVVR